MPETLAELVTTYKGVRSYGDLAKDSGITHSMWQRWGTGVTADSDDARGIKIASVKAIARTLGLPERRVWSAVGATYGLDVEVRGETALDLALTRYPIDTLTPAQIEIIAALVGAFCDDNAAIADLQTAKTEAPAKVRPLRAARRRTGSEERGADSAKRPTRRS